jgi:hypothetical protein
MKIHNIFAVGLVSVLGGCAGTQSLGPRYAAADCTGLGSDATVASLYSSGKIRKVEPIYRRQFLARAIQPVYVAGAKLYVPAQRDLNPAYLERVLSCHARSGSVAHANDPLRARGITDVDVAAQGPMLRIEITGADRAAGKDIWQRTRTLYERSDVAVEQLSGEPDSHSAL